MKLYVIPGYAVDAECPWMLKYSREDCGNTASKKNLSMKFGMKIVTHDTSVNTVICLFNNVI